MKKKIITLILATGFISTGFAKVIPIVGVYQSTTTNGPEVTVVCALVSTRTCLKVLVPGGEGGPMYATVLDPDGNVINRFDVVSYTEKSGANENGVAVNNVTFELP